MKMKLAAALLVAFGLAACATQNAPVQRDQIFRTYFAPGQHKLTDAGYSTVLQAAKRYKAGGQEVIVGGHTDSSGNAALNTALSKQRAIEVTAALVKAGVPRERIVTRYFGEAALLKMTGDGVAERNNRRVIMIVR